MLETRAISPSEYEDECTRLLALDTWEAKSPDDWTGDDWRDARTAMALVPAPSGAAEWIDEEIADTVRLHQRTNASIARVPQELAEAQRALRDAKDEQESWLREAEVRRVEGAARASAGLPTPDLAIPGCQLVAGADDMKGPVRGVTVRFVVGQPVTLLVGERAVATLEWDEIESITVEPLPERHRATAARALGLGLISLAAKKRIPVSAMTIVWGVRHLVFEVPAEAHRLRGELATAGVVVAA